MITTNKKPRVKTPVSILSPEEIERIVDKIGTIPKLSTIAASMTPQGACACCYEGNMLDTITNC